MKTGKKQDISRRTFLCGMGATAAAPYIIPASAFGANSRINFGVVGTGGQGTGVMKNAMGHDNVRVIALCDVDKSQLEKAKKVVDDNYGNTDCQTHSDYRELLARKDIDAVICGTPDHWHALVSVEAARNKKDIYCEKPLTWSLGEGQAVVKAVKENTCVFQTGSMQRSSVFFKQACELVRNGYLGDIHRILVSLPERNESDRAVWVEEFPKAPPELDWEFYVGPATWTPFHPKRYHWSWRWWLAFGGGQMMDWIGHHADIAHMAMDWDNTGPLEVEGVRWEFGPEKNNLYDQPSRYMFNCKYKGGVNLTVANASDMPKEFKEAAALRKGNLGTMFFGSKGRWVYIDRSGINASDKALIKMKFNDRDFRFRKERNHMTDFITCIGTREECIAPVNAGHRSASVGHLGKIACTLGAKFKWDPKKEEITDNPALNGMLMRRYRDGWSLEA